DIDESDAQHRGALASLTENARTIAAAAVQIELDAWLGAREREERTSAPHPSILRTVDFDRQSGELVINGPGEPRGQAIPHRDVRDKTSQLSRLKAYGVLGVRRDYVIDIGAEGEDLSLPAPAALHLDSYKWHSLDLDQHLLDRSDEVIASVILAAEHRGKQLDQRQPLDRDAPVIHVPSRAILSPISPQRLMFGNAVERPLPRTFSSATRTSLSSWSGMFSAAFDHQSLRHRTLVELARTKQDCDRIVPQSVSSSRALWPYSPLVPRIERNLSHDNTCP